MEIYQCKRFCADNLFFKISCNPHYFAIIWLSFFVIDGREKCLMIPVCNYATSEMMSNLVLFKKILLPQEYIKINYRWNPQYNCVLNVLCNNGGQVLKVLWLNWEIRIVNNNHSLHGFNHILLFLLLFSKEENCVDNGLYKHGEQNVKECVITVMNKLMYFNRYSMFYWWQLRGNVSITEGLLWFIIASIT